MVKHSQLYMWIWQACSAVPCAILKCKPCKLVTGRAMKPTLCNDLKTSVHPQFLCKCAHCGGCAILVHWNKCSALKKVQCTETSVGHWNKCSALRLVQCTETAEGCASLCSALKRLPEGSGRAMVKRLRGVSCVPVCLCVCLHVFYDYFTTLRLMQAHARTFKVAHVRQHTTMTLAYQP